MPDQHRTFFSELPFLVVSGADANGKHWVTLIDGPEGFISSPDERTLTVRTQPDAHDPLVETLMDGGDVGVLGIELATRRRNRINGRVLPSDSSLRIKVVQSFGNCPQYIRERRWRRVSKVSPQRAIRSKTLSESQIALIQSADTMFIGTGQRRHGEHSSNGFDSSHRGGEPGFVAVIDKGHLRIPDYAGNNFFNTIGNLLVNPKIGLVFVDFESGALLHVSGTTQINWEPEDSHDPGARRMIEMTIDAVIERPAALSLRWSEDDEDLLQFTVIDKVEEAAGITSFHLARADGLPLEPVEAGQHLPIELDIPGQPGPVRRSYSLSGAPASGFYRLTIKRESKGLASRYMHDVLKVGDRIRARRPSGDFAVPCTNCPLILVSAGVGLTPMVSMLHAVAGESSDRPVWFVHGTRSGSTHAMRSEVATLVAANRQISSLMAYSRPDSQDRQGIDFDTAGRINAATLIALNAGDAAHYMICGPGAFIADLRSGLEQQGVATDRIHFETFGPAS
ncbi:FAD-binding oxidoreductase [Erythrobacter rubeus]|uniref:Pyridoxamine 5'-phosphate oxidase family protein n=1 Tax=Erythrobacter rubeus TaxID=2760803 RepID=A0ABR8KNA8_9SPHN|nr:pyridoxamine 5'-phosphate oxidase family protein [Erythrobacter rubeus]MBD2842138.1 pyridoxamine 5'-phosphate oxidase family protein [Erythrobacter rubeus]